MRCALCCRGSCPQRLAIACAENSRPRCHTADAVLRRNRGPSAPPSRPRSFVVLTPFQGVTVGTQTDLQDGRSLGVNPSHSAGVTYATITGEEAGQNEPSFPLATREAGLPPVPAANFLLQHGSRLRGDSAHDMHEPSAVHSFSLRASSAPPAPPAPPEKAAHPLSHHANLRGTVASRISSQNSSVSDGLVDGHCLTLDSTRQSLDVATSSPFRLRLLEVRCSAALEASAALSPSFTRVRCAGGRLLPAPTPENPQGHQGAHGHGERRETGGKLPGRWLCLLGRLFAPAHDQSTPAQYVC